MPQSRQTATMTSSSSTDERDQLSVPINAALKHRLKVVATELRIPMWQAVERAVREWVDKEGKK